MHREGGGGWHVAPCFKCEVVPKLDAFTLSEISKATGLSLAACSRIRAGARVPHPAASECSGALTESG